MSNPHLSRKRKTAIIILCLILVGFVALCVFGHGEVKITPREAQTAIDKGLPFTKSGAILGMPYEIVFESAQIGFNGDESVRVLLIGEGRTRDYGDARLALGLVGVPRFKDRSFFFHTSPDKIVLERMTLSEKAVSIAKDAKTMAGNAKDAVAGLAERMSKGTTLEGKTREKIDALTVSAGKAFAEKLKDAASNFLDNHPVYTLKDYKGILIDLAIEKVFVRDGNLVIAYSFFHLAWFVLVGITIIVSSIAFLVMAPARS